MSLNTEGEVGTWRSFLIQTILWFDDFKNWCLTFQQIDNLSHSWFTNIKQTACQKTHSFRWQTSEPQTQLALGSFNTWPVTILCHWTQTRNKTSGPSRISGRNGRYSIEILLQINMFQMLVFLSKKNFTISKCSYRNFEIFFKEMVKITIILKVLPYLTHFFITISKAGEKKRILFPN